MPASASAASAITTGAVTTGTASTYTKIEVTTPHPFARLQNPSRWEIARMVLGVVSGLVPLRLFIMTSTIVVGGSLTVILHHLGFRSLCIYNLRISCRCLLLASGHFWIPIEYSNGSTRDDVFGRGSCPKIIVSNHISNMEILHMLTLPFQDAFGNPALPSFVTKESIFGLPIIGTITKDVVGSIGVRRKKQQQQQQKQQNLEGNQEAPSIPNTTKTDDKDEAAAAGTQQSQQLRAGEGSCTEQIHSRVRGGDEINQNNVSSRGPIVIFPEGTTTNGTCLLAFKKGAFAPLVTVLPVLYSFGANASDPTKSDFLPTYDSIWSLAYLWRLFCQPVHPFRCHILEPMAPEKDVVATNSDPASHYAERVRSKMALEGDLPMLSEKYNYRHKLQYHNGLRKAFVTHPKGPKHAMCFAPMQKVFPDESNSTAAPSSVEPGYDVVVGTRFVDYKRDTNRDKNLNDDHCNSKEKKDI